MEEQLQQLINLQKEQVELLKKHLWRLRFSLATLLLLTTASCIALGYMAYQNRTATITVTPAAITTYPPIPAGSAGEPPPLMYVAPAEVGR